jgi:hypothetical protein
LQQLVVDVANQTITETWLQKGNLERVHVTEKVTEVEWDTAHKPKASKKDIATKKEESKKDEAKKHVGKMLKKPTGK